MQLAWSECAPKCFLHHCNGFCVKNPSRTHDSQLIALQSILAAGYCQRSDISSGLQVALGFLSFSQVPLLALG